MGGTRDPGGGIRDPQPQRLGPARFPATVSVWKGRQRTRRSRAGSARGRRHFRRSSRWSAACGAPSRLRAVLEGRPFELWGGEQKRDFTYVEDAADAFLLAAATPATEGGVYNIGGGSRVTMNAAVELLGELMGVRPRVEYQPRAAGDHRHGAADISRARSELNYHPRVTLAEGLRRQVEWQRGTADGG